MKKLFVVLTVLAFGASAALAWDNFTFPKPKKFYTQDTQRHYNTGGQVYIQNGYIKQNGNYVQPHIKTKPDAFKWNNWNEQD